MRRSNDYSARKYISGETPLVEVPIGPNVQTRAKDIVYTPNKYWETKGIMV
jgi:hypothetical protein